MGGYHYDTSGRAVADCGSADCMLCSESYVQEVVTTTKSVVGLQHSKIRLTWKCRLTFHCASCRILGANRWSFTVPLWPLWVMCKVGPVCNSRWPFRFGASSARNADSDQSATSLSALRYSLSAEGSQKRL
jgi:hypothetical protein